MNVLGNDHVNILIFDAFGVPYTWTNRRTLFIICVDHINCHYKLMRIVPLTIIMWQDAQENLMMEGIINC